MCNILFVIKYVSNVFMEEKKMILPPKIKPKKGRPTAIFSTITKTYRFFEEDITYINKIGATPKEIFKLGCLAKRNNPQMGARIRELEKGNEKLQSKVVRLFNATQAYESKIKELQDESKAD